MHLLSPPRTSCARRSLVRGARALPAQAFSQAAPRAFSSEPQRVIQPEVPRPAQDLIASVAPIEVEGLIARCDGGAAPPVGAADAAPVGAHAHAHCCPTGGGALGHPVEFIQLNKVNVSAPEVCKYCGLRFVMKKGYVASGH